MAGYVLYHYNIIDRSRIGDVGVNGRLAGADQDQVTAMLSSDVMEQRPMAIHRSMRQPSDELPEPLELKAQVEGLYGKAEHKRARRALNARDLTEDEPPPEKSFGNPWGAPKDGKRWIDPKDWPRIWRK
ncbi:hypothetical protein [uncultured Tateyamaria sp.]|uniref:hypothetical protein n=1 Tax=uncultured Tateyamaria sp. TaxID=455651 RepID=UPI002605998B|nr:hypothetical protein [uncultured Tateyamaria sp.]